MFVYLGLLVGANPRKASNWQPVVQIMDRRLHSWRNRYVSMGGQFVLINSVLASISLFYLTFLNIPNCVCKSLV